MIISNYAIFEHIGKIKLYIDRLYDYNEYNRFFKQLFRVSLIFLLCITHTIVYLLFIFNRIYLFHCEPAIIRLPRPAHGVTSYYYRDDYYVTVTIWQDSVS